MKKIKAVIAAAGVGSRFFPIGKTIPKCMMPVWNQPLLAYTVADCLAAGISEIAVITAPGECTRQVRHFLAEDPELKQYFTDRGWQKKYQPLAQIPAAEFTIIEQPRDTGLYGTALPAIVAADWIGSDDFLLASGDDLLLRLDRGSDLADLVTARRAAGCEGAIAVATAHSDEPLRYGIVQPRPAAGGHPHPLVDEVRHWLPEDRQQHTAYINISRSLLPASVLPHFTAVRPADNGELRATDAINAFARDHDTLIHPIAGTFYDCGNPEGLHAASSAFACNPG
ncbi:sugar phosphate nucleotidyltransferase [Kitasatospora sp. NPDC101801]|uniref:sugar phosphate nucleotidyltransferase n=1 Tax=Kitasatospora sp. NPDC101801 TaxID=3364103 RepID=UPI00381700BA